MNKMNREVKSRWIAALRSGDYKQTQERLRRNGSHCCLGVLCDLFAKEGGKAWRTKDLSEAGPFQHYEAQGLPDKNMPGAAVLVWAQVDPSAKVRIGPKWNTLANHNDDGRTFAEIANAIEEQL